MLNRFINNLLDQGTIYSTPHRQGKNFYKKIFINSSVLDSSLRKKKIRAVQRLSKNN